VRRGSDGGFSGAKERVREVHTHCRGSGARVDVNGSPACKIKDTELLEESAAPDHVGEGVVYKGGPKLIQMSL
jgi:hypothetical protein